MKSILPLVALALACASCTGEPSSPAPAAPVDSGSTSQSAVAEAAAPQPAGVEDATVTASGENQGRAGRPHHTGPAPAVPSAGAESAAPLATSEPRRITPEDLRPLLDARQAILVDVRGASDWDFHRAAEAIHIPYDALRARAAELPHEALIALYCT